MFSGFFLLRNLSVCIVYDFILNQLQLQLGIISKSMILLYMCLWYLSLENIDIENINVLNPENRFCVNYMLYWCHWGKETFSSFIFPAKVSHSSINIRNDALGQFVVTVSRDCITTHTRHWYWNKCCGQNLRRPLPFRCFLTYNFINIISVN
jgi:hypothetical protein